MEDRNNAGQSYVVYEDPITQERLTTKAPLQSLVDVGELRREIGIPDYVNLNDFQMKKTIAAFWAFRYPEKFVEGVAAKPLEVATFGGGGFRLHCPSSNREPFFRRIADIDFVTLKENGTLVVKVLCGLSEKCGSMFFYGLSTADKRFNILRAGARYRVHTIKSIDDLGTGTPGLTDIFCDRLPFCHKLDVRDGLSEAESQHFTIGLENLIISKAQLIKTVTRDDAKQIDECRIIGEFDKRRMLVGMEMKDMRDIAAALVDHDVGQGPDRIDVNVIGTKLKRDWPTWKTVTTNLRNMLQRSKEIARVFGASEHQREAIEKKLTKILEQLEGQYAPKRRIFSFSKQWWEDVEDQTLK